MVGGYDILKDKLIAFCQIFLIDYHCDCIKKFDKIKFDWLQHKHKLKIPVAIVSTEITVNNLH